MKPMRRILGELKHDCEAIDDKPVITFDTLAIHNTSGGSFSFEEHSTAGHEMIPNWKTSSAKWCANKRSDKSTRREMEEIWAVK